MTVIRIGYQGEFGSNSERASKLFVVTEKIDSETLIPCENSENVANELVAGRIEYGVMAIKNSSGGDVKETEQALAKSNLSELARIALPISHDLFASEFIPFDQIKSIHSHPQALKQCKETLSKLCPKAELVEAKDTALAALKLAKGELPPGSAVICSRNAGSFHSLELLQGEIQDRSDNVTTFALFEMPKSAEPKEEEYKAPTFLISPTFTNYFVQFVAFVSIFLAFLARDYWGWSSWQSAVAISGFLGSLTVFLASKNRDRWLHQSLISGYWRYSQSPTKPGENLDQAHQVDRVVHIDKDDAGNIRLRGWRIGDGESHRWENKAVLVSPPGRKKGKIVYEYTNTQDHDEFKGLDGIVHLSWNKSSARQRVNRMSGRYLGFSTGDTGRIKYQRIDKDTFDSLRS